MKIVLFLFFLLLVNSASADTCDFWQVQYNKKAVAQMNACMPPEQLAFHWKKSVIQQGDEIGIFYASDHPTDAEMCIVFKSGEHELQTELQRDHANNKFYFPMAQLSEWVTKLNANEIKVLVFVGDRFQQKYQIFTLFLDE